MRSKIEIILYTLLKLRVDVTLKFAYRPTSVGTTASTTASIANSLLLMMVLLLFRVILSLELIVEIFLSFFRWWLHFCLSNRLWRCLLALSSI